MSSDRIGVGHIVGLGVDLFLALIFYKWYKGTNETADDIKKSKTYKLDNDLFTKVTTSESGYIPYACVEGEVLPVGQILHSKHVEGQNGVIQSIILEEHKSKRIQGVWSDVKNVMQDTTQTVPFVLRRWWCKQSKTEVQIAEPLSASFLIDDLTITHNAFTPEGSVGLVSRGLDRLFGEVTKGYHETEKMLLTNTLLLGIGEIALVDGKLQLLPPRSGAKYILTKKSKAEVIKILESKSFWIKFLVIGTGIIGVSILGHILYKLYKRSQNERTREGFVAHIRELRAQAERRLNEEDTSENAQDNTCVVCLSNPREIVLLNCGHICLCADCVVELPEPLFCPVCRQSVERYVTTYHP